MALVRMLVGVLALVLLLLAVVRSWPQVRSTVETVGPAASLGALLVAAVASTSPRSRFRSLMVGMHEGTSVRGDVEDFFASQLAKYLPGGIWAVAAQTELSADSGVPRSRSGAASVLNWRVSLAAAVYSGRSPVPDRGAGPELLPSDWPWPCSSQSSCSPSRACVAASLALALAGPVGQGRRAGADDLGSRTASTSACSSTRSGTDRPVAFGDAVGTFALAWASGLVAVIAPAGIGVREVVLVSCSSPMLSGGHAAALAVAVVSRFLITVSDAALGLAATASRRRDARPERAEPHPLPMPSLNFVRRASGADEEGRA